MLEALYKAGAKLPIKTKFVKDKMKKKEIKKLTKDQSLREVDKLKKICSILGFKKGWSDTKRCRIFYDKEKYSKII